MRDSRTGYLIPARYGLGLWPDGKIVGATSSPPSASPGNHLEKVTLTDLVFGPEWVSYERSRRMRHAKMREISARVFFVKIPKSQDSMIYTISNFFSGYIFPKWILSLCFSVTRPGRPSDPAARHGSQVTKMSGSFLFPGSQVIKTTCSLIFPVFQGSNPSQNQT